MPRSTKSYCPNVVDALTFTDELAIGVDGTGAMSPVGNGVVVCVCVSVTVGATAGVAKKYHAPPAIIIMTATTQTKVEVFIPLVYQIKLGHCREAAETHFLPRAGLEIAVTAFANQNRRFVGLFDPMAILLKGLGRPLGLDVLAGVLGLILSLMLGHSGAVKLAYPTGKWP